MKKVVALALSLLVFPAGIAIASNYKTPRDQAPTLSEVLKPIIGYSHITELVSNEGLRISQYTYDWFAETVAGQIPAFERASVVLTPGDPAIVGNSLCASGSALGDYGEEVGLFRICVYTLEGGRTEFSLGVVKWNQEVTITPVLRNAMEVYLGEKVDETISGYSLVPLNQSK